MKPCLHGHPLSNRYRNKKGILHCRGCEYAAMKVWRKTNPEKHRRAAARSMRAFYRRERFWRAWQALGELRDPRREAVEALSEESPIIGSLYCAIHRRPAPERPSAMSLLRHDEGPQIEQPAANPVAVERDFVLPAYKSGREADSCRASSPERAASDALAEWQASRALGNPASYRGDGSGFDFTPRLAPRPADTVRSDAGRGTGGYRAPERLYGAGMIGYGPLRDVH